MERIDFDDLAVWCKASGYQLEDWIPTLSSTARMVDLAIPSEPLALTELIDDLVNIGRDEIERLLWVRDWTIWNERSQEIGLRHLGLLVDNLPAGASESSGHIYVLRASEWREAIALLTIPILYGWDAHLLFQSGNALVDVSHEGRISVSLASESVDAGRLDAWRVHSG